MKVDKTESEWEDERRFQSLSYLPLKSRHFVHNPSWTRQRSYGYASLSMSGFCPKMDAILVWKKDNDWNLTPEQYHVLREKGTEPAFSGEYDSLFDPGTYSCGACGAKLFDSDKKFDAQCGWPSFYDAIAGTVVLSEDDSLGMSRTEVTCATCGSHLGHVFEGEGLGTPTDQRYCINSLSLQFTPQDN